MKRHFFLFVLFILLLSCTSPMERKFNKETSKADIEALREELDSAAFMLLAGSLVRLQLEEVPLETMTYAEILENGKKWQAAEAENRKKEIGSRIDRRRNYPNE
ncbi:hypothetical protein HPE56_11755 [Maribacter sp. ANRC-HE7]|uniref:Uncharacterized protein n=1 Tax=Maribacter aquimaris TaxID=2737171 RepID=A0ABR7V486_9FLAO|nr:hypothetical protein [Maribacter aquimaris]MBD0778471.1 hypothetical protein [Maribacter aquimaris]